MKKLCSALLSALLLLLALTGCGNKAVFSQNSLPAAVPAAAKDLAADSGQDLRLAAGDKLTVEVWGHDNLTKQVTVDRSGAVHYPLIGAVQAAGPSAIFIQAIPRRRDLRPPNL